MSDVAKHGSVVGHGVIPGPIVPPIPDRIKDLIDISIIRPDAGRTVFDGEDHTFFDASFDIEGAAARAVAAYDRNNDGSIDIGTSVADGFHLGEETRITGRHARTSIEQLAKHADEAGNGDGSATAEEIADVIRKFDQGTEGDGRLSGQERETFLAVFGEQQRPTFRHFKPHPLPFPLEPRPIHRHPGEILLGDHPPFNKLQADAAKLSDADAVKGP